MADNKYISTKDAVRLTGLSTQEIYNLIHSGVLPARKAPKSGWRISQQDLEALGLINEEADSMSEKIQTESSAYYVADEEHYTQVFKRMTEVKHNLKIATGDLKNFIVSIESENGEEKKRLCDFFLSLVDRGVHVQVVSMDPFYFYLNTKKSSPRLLTHPLFELRHKRHCHMKLFIFDDECAYFSSANITGAAIGRRANGNRNNEAGMLVWGTMMQEPLRHFEIVWNDPDCLKHTWKRFTKKANELEKELKGRLDK